MSLLQGGLGARPGYFVVTQRACHLVCTRLAAALFGPQSAQRKIDCPPERTLEVPTEDNQPAYCTTTCRTVSDQNGIGGLPSLVRLDHELVMGSHHQQKPVVRLTGTVDAVGGGEAERDLSRRAASVGVDTADGETGSVGHAVKLWAMVGRCDGGMGLRLGQQLALLLFGQPDVGNGCTML